MSSTSAVTTPTAAVPAAARPRVVLLTMPTLFGAEIINRLAADTGIELVGIGLSVRLSQKKGQLAAVGSMLTKTGWRYMRANALEADVSWGLLKLTGRPWGLKQLAGRVRPLDDVNSAASLDWLQSLSPDYIVSFYFNQWIGERVCAVPAKRCVNVHPSLLPALRGPDPVFRAIQRNLPRTGLTIHEIAKELDSGRILHQELRDIPSGASRFTLYHSLIRDGADVVARWMAGAIPSAPDISADLPADYATFPTPTEVNEYLKSGHLLIRLSEWRKALADVR